MPDKSVRWLRITLSEDNENVDVGHENDNEDDICNCSQHRTITEIDVFVFLRYGNYLCSDLRVFRLLGGRTRPRRLLYLSGHECQM